MPRRPPKRNAPHRFQSRERHQRHYNYSWSKRSKAYREVNPYCEVCIRFNRVTPCVAVDHIIPHRGDNDLFDDPDNWQSICKDCHDIKTRLETSGRVMTWTPKASLVVLAGEDINVATCVNDGEKWHAESDLFKAFDLARHLSAQLRIVW